MEVSRTSGVERAGEILPEYLPRTQPPSRGSRPAGRRGRSRRIARWQDAKPSQGVWR